MAFLLFKLALAAALAAASLGLAALGVTTLLGAILEVNGFLVGSMINSNFNLEDPPSIGAPLYFSTALLADLLDLKIIVAIPLN